MPRHGYLVSKEWARQARRSAPAVHAQLISRESLDVESGGAQLFVGFLVFGDCKETLFSEGKNVAGEGVAFGNFDLDEIESA